MTARERGDGAGGAVRTGIGGWSFPAWRQTFYPPEVKAKDELAHASRALGSIEINTTFYRTQAEAVFAGWRAQVPDGFVFSVKAPRGATATKDAGRASASVERFLSSGLTALGPCLGPILWQFPATRRFDAAGLEAFLDLLPDAKDGIRLRHAIEFVHPSAADPAFEAMLAARGIAAALVAPDPSLPPLRDTAPFVYARLKGSVDEAEAGFAPAALDAIASGLEAVRRGRDLFAYVIGGAKHRNPNAAIALARRLPGARPLGSDAGGDI